MDAEKKKWAIMALIGIVVLYVVAQMIITKNTKLQGNPDLAGGFGASLKRADEKNKAKELTLDADGNPVQGVVPVAPAPAAAPAE